MNTKHTNGSILLMPKSLRMKIPMTYWTDAKNMLKTNILKSAKWLLAPDMSIFMLKKPFKNVYIFNLC